MSGRKERLKYDFDDSPNSTYARAARLISAAHSDGRVLDLGAGVGALAQATARHGLGYVGVDGDPDNVERMQQRGIDAHIVDLAGPDVVERLVALVNPSIDDPVVAVSMLDVIEHLPEPERTVDGLTQLIDRIGAAQAGNRPLLVVSIPNVAHYDLGAKLLVGRWDITDVGLLDSTHITLFTEQRVHDVLGRHYAEVGREDVVFPVTEQRVPKDHPVFGSGALGGFLRHIRGRSDDLAETYQFVRAYQRTTDPPADQRPGDETASAPLTDGDDTAPFCSVIVRTQGSRTSLVDALTSLAAQTDRDLEVLLMVHHPDADVVDAVADLVRSFDDEFAAAVRVEPVVGGGRTRPLNAALELARGRYVAFLDDDDIVTTDWIATFRDLADGQPGTLLRAGCVVQWIEQRSTPLIDFEPVSGFDAMYPTHFDLLDSIRANRSPPCSFAVPMATVRAFDIRFDDTIRVCEDWKFQLDVARYAGVADTAAITSVYRRWRGLGGSEVAEDRDVWITDHERVVDDLDRVPTVFPPGSLRRVHDLYTRIEHLERELGRRGADDPPLRLTE